MRSNTQITKSNQAMRAAKRAAKTAMKITMTSLGKVTSLLTLGIGAKQWMAMLMICTMLSWSVFALPIRAALLVNDMNASGASASGAGIVNESLPFWRQAWTSANAKTEEWMTPWREVNVVYKNTADDDKADKSKSDVDKLSPKEVLEKRVKTIDIQIGNKGKVTVGGEFPLSAILKDAKGKVIDGIMPTWTSSNPDVVKIGDDSHAIALKTGEVSLKAEVGTAGKEISVKVEASEHQLKANAVTNASAASSLKTKIMVSPTPVPSDPDRPILATGDLTVLVSPRSNLGNPMGQTEAASTSRPSGTLPPIRERAGIGNFNFGFSLASLPGRGMDAGIGLSYNSQLWTKSGSSTNYRYTYNVDGNWLAPGFQLSYGYLDVYGTPYDSSNQLILTDADGTRRQLTPVSSSGSGIVHVVYLSNDGSFVQADLDYNTSNYAITNLKVTYTDGKIVEYGNPNTQKRRFPVKITDINGNYISIAYPAEDQLGKMSDITDTLGRHILFHYDTTTQKLISVSVPAFNDTQGGRLQTVRFYYEDLTLSTAGRFTGTITAPTTPVSVLKYVYFPGTKTGYRYDYSPYFGMVYKITRLEGVLVTGGDSLTQEGTVNGTSYLESAFTEYDYPGTSLKAFGAALDDVPKYENRIDDWIGRDTTAPAPTTKYNLIEPSPGGTGTRTMTVTSPDGTMNVSVSKVDSGAYDDGLTQITYLTSPGRAIPWTKSTLTWEPVLGTVGRQNPRLSKIETANEVGQVHATTFAYDNYNNQTLVAEHDFAAAGAVGAELRRTETTYVSTGDWIANHLYHLPLSVKRTVNNAVISRTDYQYDQNPLTDRANVAQYDIAFNPNVTTTYQCNCEYVCDAYVSGDSGRCAVPYRRVCQDCPTYNSRHNARGNVTTVKAFADPTIENDPKAQTTTLKYDITGNTVEVGGLSCCGVKTSQYSADYQYAYPTSETRGTDVTLMTSAVYDFNTGLIKTLTDENNQPTNYEYEPDTLRQKKIIYPNNGYTLTEYSDKLVTSSAQLVPGYVRTKTTLEANKTAQSYSYYDGRGALIRGAAQTPDGWSISAVEYDSIGRARKSYNPFYGSTPTDAVPANVKWTEAANYDGLGRTTAVTLQDGTTVQTLFAGTITTITDQAGKQRRRTADALGRIARVDEPNANGNLDVGGAPAQPTAYEYDGNDNLTKVTQIDGATTQERRFKYDALSRLTHERQVEADATLDNVGGKGGIDPNKWTKVLKYDSRGLLTDGYDARGVNTHFDYDGLNRIWKVTYSDATPQVMYTYDQARTGFFNKGALTTVATAQGDALLRPDTAATATELDYDLMGRVKAHRQSIGAQIYNLEYAYNLAGQLTSETYPSGKVINYGFDVNGRLSNIADASRTYLNNLQYQGKGNSLSSMNLGNGTNQTFTLNDRLQMNNQTLSKGSEILQRYDYTYGQVDSATGDAIANTNNGQLGKVESYIGSQKQWSQRFNYDSIGRLAEVREYKVGDNTHLSYKQKFDFDRFGNLYRKNTSNPTTGQETPIAYTPIEETDISKATNRFTTNTGYDEAGNVIQDNKFRSMGFAYDANGRMVKATKANASDAVSVYDAGGRRIAEKVNDVWRFSIYDIGGKMVAEYGGLPSTDEGGIKYVLQDWQGSTRAIVSNTGFVNARMDYQAFGEEIQTGIGQRTTTQGFDASNNLQDKYALTKRDEATGLDHTWFRKNENRAGRWTSPDPYNGSMSLGNPQSFNRYSYVNNQPTNFIDPSGLFTVCRTYSEGWVDPVTHVVNVHERTECTSYFENGGGGTIYDPGRNGGGIGDPGNHGGGVRIERDGGSTPSEPKTKKDDEYKDYNECERAEKRKCYEKGANSFYDNAPTYMFFGALGFAGGMNTIYSIIKGVSLWGVTRIAGVIGLTVGAVLGLRRAALEGDRLDKECRADIPKKCEKYKK